MSFIGWGVIDCIFIWVHTLFFRKIYSKGTKISKEETLLEALLKIDDRYVREEKISSKLALY
jgi:hypothetical protein